MNGINVYTILFRVLPLVSFALLIALWAFAMLRLKGTPRLVLLLVGCIAFVLAVILFGGQWLLEQRELSWRQWVKSVFALLLWCAGFAVSILTVYWIPRAVRRGGAVIRRCLCGVTVLCMVFAMGFGTLMGGLWIGPSSDEVIVYHGVKAVQEESNWFDEHMVIYEYHSLFTRGRKAIGPIGG